MGAKTQYKDSAESELEALRRENRALRGRLARHVAEGTLPGGPVTPAGAGQGGPHAAAPAGEVPFRTIVEASIEGIALISAQRRIVFANQSFADVFGYDGPDAVIGRPSIDFIAPHERERLNESFLARMAGRQAESRYEYQGLRRDGSLAWIDRISTRIEWEGQWAVLATFVDITARKEAEQALRASEELVRSILDHSSALILLKDLQGRFLLVNRRFREFVGTGDEDARGMRSHEVHPPEVADLLVAQDREVMESGQPVERIRTLGSADGRQHRLLINKFPVRSPDGEMVAVGAISTDITEQSKAEEALRNSERLLRMVFDLVPHWLYLKDEQSTLLMANEAMAGAFGLTTDQMAGRRTADLPGIPSELVREWIEQDLQVIQSGEMYDAPDNHANLEDGSDRWWHVVKFPLRDAEGGITGIVGMTEDVTARKQAEVRLRESERRFRTLVEQASDGIFVTDTEGRYIDVNERGCALLGCSRDDLLGRNVREFMSTEDLSTFGARQRQLSESMTILYERDLVRVDGTRVRAEISARELEDGATLAFVRDITARKEAEAALKESEERFRTLVEGSLQGVVIHRDRILFANQSAADMLGYDSPAELMAVEDYERLISEEMWPAARDRIHKRLMGEAVINRLEREMVRNDGSRVHTEAFVTTVNWQGEVAVQSTFIDVTTRKMAEEQLRQAQKMEAVGQLAGGVAHDFNNALTPIVGYTQMLLRKAEPGSEQESWLRVVDQAAQRARDLVAQILLFSRQTRPSRQSISLVGVADEAVRFLRHSLPSTISIALECAGDHWIEADSAQMHQVLMNLCINAGHAMHSGGVLHISIVREEVRELECYMGTQLSGDYVRLSVSDTGTGMGDDTMAHMFEPFFTTKGVGKGTGLGLASVLGIVQQHSGGIRIQSALGSGTTVEVYLPAGSGWPEPDRAMEAPCPPGKGNILVVDDEPMIVELVQHMLVALGYRVSGLTDSGEALKLLEAQPTAFDLMVTDLTMPRLSGIELAQRLRALNPHIPIVLCTGFGDELLTGAQVGPVITRLLRKPFNQTELSGLLLELLATHRGP